MVIRLRLPDGPMHGQSDKLFEWTGTAYQEQQAAGQTGIVLMLALLFASWPSMRAP